ncbi:ABC transporter permease subunit [Anaeromicropila populeti]|uniref:ABC-2 family transporter protein n=1 Tax=Anaeromicropila populeti TaxID=37658 RepID=A0A1I6J371_9FIRM|nr:ABC transporter permease subunit [Anaeromicropila populeti]SFR72940.1 ABC-2 family transporter protein [Anaeromicropila populeti]
MNVYLYEMKLQIKSFLIWSGVIVASLFAFMIGFYPVFQDSLEEIMNMIEGLPKEYTLAFGFEMSNLNSYVGFYNFTFSYISLMGAIMSLIMAISVFGREKRSKCLDFIFVKPISRKKLFCMKGLTCISMTTVLGIIYAAALAFCYRLTGQTGRWGKEVLVLGAGFYFTQLFFIVLGIFAVVYLKKIRSVSGAATSFGCIAFILSALANITGDKIMTFAAPLKYFEPDNLLNAGKIEYAYMAAAIIITVVCISIAYVRFCKQDIHAV